MKLREQYWRLFQATFTMLALSPPSSGIRYLCDATGKNGPKRRTRSMSANPEIEMRNPNEIGDGDHRATLLAYRNNIYSQCGEDGIIDAILSRISALNGWCVEFGAWDGVYLSNTRNLIEKRGYNAILVEADKKSFAKLKENTKHISGIFAINTFVGFSPTDNLDVVLSTTACPRDFDLLSIDIDGNDIHVWRAFTQYRPKLVCVEFNPTIPTEVDFEQPANPKLNVGSSLAALVRLGKEKRYELICANE